MGISQAGIDMFVYFGMSLVLLTAVGCFGKLLEILVDRYRK